MMSSRRATIRPAPVPDSARAGGDDRLSAAGSTGFAPAQALIESLNVQLTAVLNAAIDGLVMIDESGTIRVFNPAAVRMFGYEPNEVVGENVGMLMPEPHRAEHDRYIADYLDTGRGKIIGKSREVVARRQDGTTFPIELAISEMRINGERMFLGTMRDITGRKLAEQEKDARFVAELTRSNAELARFAYIASHDLQEPLRMIASYLDLLSARYGDALDTDAQEFIAFAVDGAARMKRLISDLLEYSRVGGDALKVEPIDLGALVGEAVSSLGMVVAETGARVDIGQLPWVMGDASQLRRVFQNLIGNALKYRSEAPPHIRIEAARTADGWRFDVADNGIGVDPRFSKKVFEVFARLHSRARYPGSGIGLAVARLAVERHGGSIWVEPAEGGGSRFSFTLPESEV